MSSGAVLADTNSSRGTHVHKSIWVLAALATTFLGLRIYCKFRRRRGLWWDDYFLLLSWILLLVSAITTTVAVHNGFGHHYDAIDSGSLKLLRILGLVSAFSSFTSAVASKTSFAVTLIRLSDGWLRRFEWAIVVSLNLLLPICAYCIFGFCTPTAKIWKPYLEGKCRSTHVAVVVGIVFGSYMAFCDIALALLPWGILMRFRMYRREKISIAIAMSMGVFTCAVAIVKCTKMPLLESSDFTFEAVPLVVWGFAGSAVSIMAASVPAIRALADDVFGPRIRYRMFRSLVISHARKSPAGNGTTLVTNSTPVSPPTCNSRQGNRGDGRFHPQSNLSSAVVTAVEPADPGELISGHPVEGTASDACHRLQEVV